ncbi:MAG: hypothetical protein QXG53_05440 [Candidatus Nitrosocaldus sp.]
MQSNKEELKKSLLDLLLEDTEFRHAVAGAIGYKEILDRIAKVEEEIKALREEANNLREETNNLRKDLNDLRRDMNEGFRRHDEELKRHWESIEKLRQDMHEGFRRHDKLLQELWVGQGSLGRRMGKDLEKLILNIYRDQLIQLGIDEDKARRFEYIDIKGLYGLKGKRYELDVVVSNSHLDILEVKSHIEEEDIVVFYEKVNSIRSLIEREYKAGVRRLIVVAVHMDKEAVDKAKELGIECIYGNMVID